MKHLEEAEYDFEKAAQALLHKPTPAVNPRDGMNYENTVKAQQESQKISVPLPTGVYTADIGEMLALMSYAVLLLFSFYAAHMFDSGDALVNAASKPVCDEST